jgi:hypothetical protein
MIRSTTFSLAAIAACLFFSFTATAQIPQWKLDLVRQDYAEWGVKAGANFEQINGYPFLQTYNPGGMAGVYIGKHGKTFGVRLEATVSTASYKTMDAASHSFVPTKDKPADTVSKGDFMTASVNVPLLLQISPCKHFLFQFGPEYTHQLMINDNNGAFNKTNKSANLFKADHYSLIIGVESHIGHKVRIGASYTQSISDVNNGAIAGISDKWMNSSAQVYLMLNIKKWYSKRG